jgi:transposase
MSVSLIARQHGIAPNQVFTWRRFYAEGALLAVGAGEEVVPASEYRAVQHQVRELQRLLGKKTLENEVRRDALERIIWRGRRLCRSPRSGARWAIWPFARPSAPTVVSA